MMRRVMCVDAVRVLWALRPRLRLFVSGLTTLSRMLQRRCALLDFAVLVRVGF